MATFTELQDMAADYAEVWGFANTKRPPVWATLVNEAYSEICFEAELIRGPSVTFPTVDNQPEYDLLAVAGDYGGAWKSVQDVYYNGTYIGPIDEALLRRQDPTWLTTTKGTPVGWMMPRPNTLRLFPAPDSVVNVEVWGIRAPEKLALGTDVPVFSAIYHNAIAIRAAWLHANRFAKGDDHYKMLAQKDAMYREILNKLKANQMEHTSLGTGRRVWTMESDRIAW